MFKAVPLEALLPSTKCEGLSYPIHFLKSCGSDIKFNFLEYRTKQATLFARQNDFFSLFATNKQNIYSTGIFRAPLVKKTKEVPFF